MELTGYTDIVQEGGRTMATAHYDDGSAKRCEVRLSVESQVTRADGTVEPAREVASSDDGSVRVAGGAAL